METNFINIPKKQNKLSNPSVAKMVNIGDESPNSIISFSYRLNTSLSTTLDVMVNANSVRFRNLKIVSVKAKR